MEPLRVCLERALLDFALDAAARSAGALRLAGVKASTVLVCVLAVGVGCASEPQPSSVPAEPVAQTEPDEEPEVEPASEADVDEPPPPMSKLNVAYLPARLDLEPLMPASEGPNDEQVLFALRRQFFLGSVTDKARAQIAIADAKPRNKAVAKAHRLCVQAQWPISVGHTWLEGLDVATGGMTDQRTGKCMDAIMKEIEKRGAAERSAEGVDTLAKQRDAIAFGLDGCHNEMDDLSIVRAWPKSPSALKRPEGVEAGTRSDIVVQINGEGRARLAAVVNADPGDASQACFDSLGREWSPPSMEGEPTPYCRFVRCQF